MVGIEFWGGGLWDGDLRFFGGGADLSMVVWLEDERALLDRE